MLMEFVSVFYALTDRHPVDLMESVSVFLLFVKTMTKLLVFVLLALSQGTYPLWTAVSSVLLLWQAAVGDRLLALESAAELR